MFQMKYVIHVKLETSPLIFDLNNEVSDLWDHL